MVAKLEIFLWTSNPAPTSGGQRIIPEHLLAHPEPHPLTWAVQDRLKHVAAATGPELARWLSVPVRRLQPHVNYWIAKGCVECLHLTEFSPDQGVAEDEQTGPVYFRWRRDGAADVL